ncbi:hypothetical protein E5676_scaffold827G00080 [Cucumis melo var. makuwa]|uniref:Uncharacterized protein n=1 Tax=Cucumis melo var. makuwa TaxID=1194695 RepID=A0A5D3BQM1_CUCMM|nr:hypothetical protein E5676_scaffold827G00080 [Cucumis melo var. makuwa]
MDRKSRVILRNPSHLRPISSVWKSSLISCFLSQPVAHRCKTSRRLRRSPSSPSRFNRRSNPNPETQAAPTASNPHARAWAYSWQPRHRDFAAWKACFIVKIRLSKSPDQIVLGVPLGSPKTSYVPPGSHFTRVRERASSWAEVEVRAKAGWRMTRSDRGEL